MPPVRIAISWSISLRRSPETGGLDAADPEGAPEVLTIRVDRASPSTSSAIISMGRPILAICSRMGSKPCYVGDLLVVDQDDRGRQDGFHLLGVGDHVGVTQPRSNCMPSTTSGRSQRSWTPRR